MLGKINKDKFFLPGRESVYSSFKEDSVINEFSSKIDETGYDDLLNGRIIKDEEILRKPFKLKLLQEPIVRN